MAGSSWKRDRTGRAATTARPVAYAWLVFALTFGLLISDYMARQVLNAVFPLLKAEWALSDAQLGALSGIVALMVGLLTFPLSLLADRLGRVRSLTSMAVMWSIATLLCGMSRNYQEMFVGRILVGVGEAAYGSVGIAVVVSVFPGACARRCPAAFMAGGLLGQVLGVGLGGRIAATYGWRAAFVVIAVAGLAIALLYPLLVRQRRMDQVRAALGEDDAEARPQARPSLKRLFAHRSLLCAYVGSGLQLYVAGALPAWLPTFFNRYYGLPIGDAAGRAALYLLIGGVGMIVCAMLSDRLSKNRPTAKYLLSAGYSLACAAALCLAFALPAGPGAARRARPRHVPRRRHRRSGRRHGRQSDAGAHPRHRLRDPHSGQQYLRPRARPDPHRPHRRRLGPARRLAACCRLPAWRRRDLSRSGSRTYAADLDTRARTAA